MLQVLSTSTKHRVVGLALALLATAALAYGVNCPIDDSSAYFTGTTKIDSASGKLLKLYKCPRGHSFWAVD